MQGPILPITRLDAWVLNVVLNEKCFKVAKSASQMTSLSCLIKMYTYYKNKTRVVTSSVKYTPFPHRRGLVRASTQGQTAGDTDWGLLWSCKTIQMSCPFLFSLVKEPGETHGRQGR